MSDIIVIQPDENNVVVSEVTNSITTASDGPQGPAGPTGATGPTGPAGSSGVVAVTAPITNSGTSSSANIGISAGTTSAAGALQLTDSVASTSTTTAATPNALKTTYDFAKSLVLPFISTFYYSSFIPVIGFGTATVNTTYYTPFFVPVTTTFDRIAIRTAPSYSGTASTRLGIYNSTNGQPSTVVLDAGTVGSTSLNQTVQITISQTLTAGVYWLASNSQTAATTNNFITNGQSANQSYTGEQFTTPRISADIYYSQSSVTGAFATATGISSQNAVAAHIVWLRAA